MPELETINAPETITPRRKVGRPTLYNDKVSETICQRIAMGHSLRRICREDPALPDLITIIRWQSVHPEFRHQYELACEERANVLAEEALEIADAAGPENASVAKLQVDTRKWFASKLKPKRYGDKVHQEHTGADGGPIQLERRPTIDWSALSPEAREAARLLLTEARQQLDGNVVDAEE